MTILIRLIKFFILIIRSLKGLRRKLYSSSTFALMSTMEKRFSRAAVVCIVILLCVLFSSAQDLEIKIKVAPQSPDSVQVEGRFLNDGAFKPDKHLSFAQSGAGAGNFGDRISDLNFFGLGNERISYKKLAPGEYLADAPPKAWRYSVDVGLPKNIMATARVSGIRNEQGILMPADLLPQFVTEKKRSVSARINFELPEGWKILSNEKKTGESLFEVSSIEKAIFFVGKSWRESEISNSRISLKIVISGEWQFSDAEVSEMAGAVFGEYQKLLGEIAVEKAMISLIRLPKEIKNGRWEAETRGANVTIVSSDMPFKTLSLQRLHEQLRHELFHLWIPNSLALSGNYDWFYEGFTVYQALRAGVETNQIRFEDFLATLSEAYNFDRLQSRTTALIEDSKNRWIGANSPVYARGMLVGFLCDIALLNKSKGKNSITKIFQEIYQKYRLPNSFDEGNAAILRVLENYAELRPIIEKYIRGAEKINWQADLETVGIKAEELNFGVKLRVETKPKGRQKDLLNWLGYNNWRKISEK